MKRHKIAIIGMGKIAMDQHWPVISASADFDLAGVVSLHDPDCPGVPVYRSAAALYAACPELDTVAICTPPAVRYALAREALLAGRNVLLEKPPALTVSELADLEQLAAAQGGVLFTAWHSQYNAGVREAKKRLAGQTISRLEIVWKEDVKRWHPGQEWIWQPGGYGVFDPGINALSILTEIAPAPFFIRSARMFYPENRQTPIAALLEFSSPAAAGSFTADFDWRQTGEQIWTIRIETAAGQRLHLLDGGSKLSVDGSLVIDEPMREYEAIYARFAGLLAKGESAVDAAPFHLVADAMIAGTRETVQPFHW